MNKQKSKKARKQKRPRFLGLPNRPPASKRYCCNCERMRRFSYNRRVGHSECSYCGSRVCKRNPPEEAKNDSEAN